MWLISLFSVQKMAKINLYKSQKFHVVKKPVQVYTRKQVLRRKHQTLKKTERITNEWEAQLSAKP
jgi:hypothetical protein